MTDSFYEDDNNAALEDSKESDSSEFDSLVGFIESKYKSAKSSRYSDESRWLQSYRNYRGVYGPNVQFTETEKSRVFIKVTKTKVLAAYGQLCDVLFSQNRFPIGVDPTEIPEGVADVVNVDPKKPADLREDPLDEILKPIVYGFPGDGKDLNPGETTNTLLDRLGSLEDELKELEGLEEGPAQTQSAVQFTPALVAVRSMPCA